jgi:hypothetical protein
MPDARECARLLGALESATGLDPALRRDLQNFLRDCLRVIGQPTAGSPETLSAIPVEHPWTEVFGEMLDMTRDGEPSIHERISAFPDAAVNGTLGVVAVQFFVDFWAELGEPWRQHEPESAAGFAERLCCFLQHALGLFTFASATYQEFPDGWLQRIGARGMVTGRVRRVVRPGLQDAQNQLRVPALVEVE